eukprot:Gb_27923 [translate_table: standard]
MYRLHNLGCDHAHGLHAPVMDARIPLKHHDSLHTQRKIRPFHSLAKCRCPEVGIHIPKQIQALPWDLMAFPLTYPSPYLFLLAQARFVPFLALVAGYSLTNAIPT